MRTVLLGAPGAGKGTQAVMLANKYNIPSISTGEIFRANIKNRTKLGKKAKEFIDKGALVPDEITIDIVEERLKEFDCINGFILDGFPRTIPQAKFLDEVLNTMNMSIDYVVDIYVPDNVILERLSGRRVCTSCGLTYHIIYNMPEKENVCDNCKHDIIQREDDSEETIKKRLIAYHKQTEPLIEYYKNEGKLYVVDGTATIEKISQEIIEILGVAK